MHNNNEATRTDEWFSAIFKWMTLCLELSFPSDVPVAENERKERRDGVWCVCVCASIGSSPRLCSLWTRSCYYLIYTLWQRLYKLGNGTVLLLNSFILLFSVTVCPIPVNSTVEWSSSLAFYFSREGWQQQLCPAKFGATVKIDGDGQWIKFGSGGEFRSIGNGNLHYIRSTVVYSMFLLLFHYQRFIFIDSFSFSLFVCVYFSFDFPFTSDSVLLLDGALLHGDGNSVDSGQRVFVMKTARKSSFCSGIKNDNKKGERNIYCSFIFSPYITRARAIRCCRQFFADNIIFVFISIFLLVVFVNETSLTDGCSLFLHPPVMTQSELSHGRSRRRKIGGVSFWSVCVILGRPVMDIFKRQKYGEREREREKKEKRRERKEEKKRDRIRPQQQPPRDGREALSVCVVLSCHGMLCWLPAGPGCCSVAGRDQTGTQSLFPSLFQF